MSRGPRQISYNKYGKRNHSYTSGPCHISHLFLQGTSLKLSTHLGMSILPSTLLFLFKHRFITVSLGCLKDLSRSLLLRAYFITVDETLAFSQRNSPVPALGSSVRVKWSALCRCLPLYFDWKGSWSDKSNLAVWLSDAWVITDVSCINTVWLEWNI